MKMNDEVNAEGPWTREDVGRVIPKRDAERHLS